VEMPRGDWARYGSPEPVGYGAGFIGSERGGATGQSDRSRLALGGLLRCDRRGGLSEPPAARDSQAAASSEDFVNMACFVFHCVRALAWP
jgi:hypothetical protein